LPLSSLRRFFYVARRLRSTRVFKSAVKLPALASEFSLKNR
jgi:hypothetical protein